MSFNYATERNRFDAEWDKLRKEYAQAGMAEESIEAMYQYDLQQFNNERAYVNHHCQLSLSHEQIGEDDEFENPFLERYFDQFTTPYDQYGTHSRYWWLEELDDPRLAAAVPLLTTEEKELLTLYFIEQYTTRELAKKYEVSHVTISQRLRKICSIFVRQ